jgi:hypothetical protein
MTADERTALVLTKVERAKKHIEELELAIRTFIDSGAYEIRAEEDANIGKRSYYLSRADPLLPQLSETFCKTCGVLLIMQPTNWLP